VSSDTEVIVLDESAFVTCIERVKDNRLVATNIFVLEHGVWKMVHHQAGPFHENEGQAMVRPPDRQLN
jgi:hypothetical protein